MVIQHGLDDQIQDAKHGLYEPEDVEFNFFGIAWRSRQSLQGITWEIVLMFGFGQVCNACLWCWHVRYCVKLPSLTRLGIMLSV